jgi:hypothetical protein
MYSKLSLVILILTLLVSVSQGQQIREPAFYEGAKYDSVYWDPAYRDSVGEYTYRLHAYRFEVLNYDLGFSLSMLPVAGQWYVDNTMKGIVYSSIRAGALAVSGIGVAGLFTAGNTWRDVGMAAGGLILYGVLKWLDITDVQHAISRNNERIVDKFNIALEDVQPTSIRYPQKDGWPTWVTEAPPAREPQPHREIFDRPLPTETQFSIGVGIPF